VGGQCVCVPLTCAQIRPAGATCGIYDDGCGGTVNCGLCTADQVCTLTTRGYQCVNIF
jgi:hypothetical protein